jgi:hypothetical protein
MHSKQKEQPLVAHTGSSRHIFLANIDGQSFYLVFETNSFSSYNVIARYYTDGSGDIDRGFLSLGSAANPGLDDAKLNFAYKQAFVLAQAYLALL